MTDSDRIPAIFVSETTWSAASIFNPNAWSIASSKGLVTSCMAELSVLDHCTQRIERLCEDRDAICKTHLEEIRKQWHLAKFPLNKLILYGEQPDLHLHIEAFFAGTKSLLDLLAQLIASERVTGGAIHGFHTSSSDGPGGRLLSVLKRNARSDRRTTAQSIEKFVIEQKRVWIDRAVMARDQLVHPKSGARQLMFQFDFDEADEQLVLKAIQPPRIGAVEIDRYARLTLEHARDFAAGLVALLKD